MEQHRPWLAQGDIFRSAPVLDVALDGESLTVRLPLGPALLLTHGCAMDKARPDGSPKADFLQFAAVRSMSSLPADRAGNVRRTRDSVAPYDVMWLGEIPPFGEAYMVLSDPYFIPVGYFDLTCLQHEEAVDDGPNLPRATPRRNESRLGRLEADRLFLLQQKMTVFWTRFAPRVADA